MQQQELMTQYEKKEKELRNLCNEEGQLKRAQGMKLDKESKQNIRRRMKKEMKEQHVQDVMGYLFPPLLCLCIIHLFVCLSVS